MPFFTSLTMTENERTAWLQLGLTVVLLGLTWPAMKIGLEAGTPVWLAAGRTATSTLCTFALVAALGRLKWPPRTEWPIIVSVGAFQLAAFFALVNLGVQTVPAGRSGVLAYTMMLWMVPLSLLVGEKVGWRALAGVALGVAGIVVLAQPERFDWSDRGVVLGPVYLLMAGFFFAVALMHARRHHWSTTPLDALPWQMSVATVLLVFLAAITEPHGYLLLDKWELWASLLYTGGLAGPIGTWIAVNVARILPPITGTLGMLGVPLVGIASSALLLGEPVTVSLAIGTACVVAGIAIVILDKSPSRP